MEIEVSPQPSEEERAVLVQAVRDLLDEPAEDRRGSWGRAALEPDEDGSA